jgi:hypothetical protein
LFHPLRLIARRGWAGQLHEEACSQNRSRYAKTGSGASTANPGRCSNLSWESADQFAETCTIDSCPSNTLQIPQFLQCLQLARDEPVCTPKIRATHPHPPRFYENNKVTRSSEKYPLKTNNLELRHRRESAVLDGKAAVFEPSRSPATSKRPVVGRSCNCPARLTRISHDRIEP